MKTKYDLGDMVVFENAEVCYEDSTIFYVVATGYRGTVKEKAVVYHVLLCSEESACREQEELDIVAEERLAAGPVCLAGEEEYAELGGVEVLVLIKEVEWSDDAWRYKFESCD